MTTTKGNDGRAARRLLWHRLFVVLSCFVGVLITLKLLGIGGNAAQNENDETTKSLRQVARGNADSRG